MFTAINVYNNDKTEVLGEKNLKIIEAARDLQP